MNLTDDLTEEVIVVCTVEDNLLFETIVGLAIYISLHRRVHHWNRLFFREGLLG